MDYLEIQTLAVQRQQALQDELDAKATAADYAQAVSHAKAEIVGQAYEEDRIDKKNKDTRSAGEARVLAESEHYQDLLALQWGWEQRADQLAIDRQYWDTLVSLTKAWLYSQSGGLR